MEAFEKSSYSIFSPASKVAQRSYQTFFGLLSGQTPSSVSSKNHCYTTNMYDQVTGIFGWLLMNKISAFLADFCFFKATPAQQGQVLRVKRILITSKDLCL